MPNDTVPAAAIGLPASPTASRVDFAIGDQLTVLVRLTDVVILAAKGLEKELAEGYGTEDGARALVELMEVVSAEAHALRHIVTGEPIGLNCDLAAVDPAAARARFLEREGAR